jgi:hypothetical protein
VARQDGEDLTIYDVDPEILTRWQVMIQRKGIDPAKQFEVMVRSFDRGPVKYGRHDVINFGKYSGMVIDDVLRADPRYMRWLVNTSEWFQLTGECIDILCDLEGR